MFCLWLTSVPPAHLQVHLCDEFLSAGTSLPNSFSAPLVTRGKPSLALRSQEKLLWSGCKIVRKRLQNALVNVSYQCLATGRELYFS